MTSREIIGCGALAAGLGLSVVSMGDAAHGVQLGPADQGVDCTHRYEDCVGGEHEAEWRCAKGQNCCTKTYYDPGPDLDCETLEDNCIVSVDTFCDAATNCNEFECLEAQN